MSVRQALLALLAEQPMHGYQLRQEFEARTGGTWPLNIGQAYTTVQRLERDGLVQALPPDDDADPERFTLTEAGRAEAAGWWLRPVEHGAPRRDELAIKLALAVTVTGVDVAQVIQRQRTETLRALRDYTRLKSRPSTGPAGPVQPDRDPVASAGAGSGPPARSTRMPPGRPGDLSWELVLDSLIFALEAEMRWLDHVEAKVLRAASRTPAQGRPASAGAPRSADPHGVPNTGTSTRGSATPPDPSGSDAAAAATGPVPTRGPRR